MQARLKGCASSPTFWRSSLHWEEVVVMVVVMVVVVVVVELLSIAP